MTQMELVCDLSGAESLAAEWDELAVTAALPLGSPGWLLAWWRHVAPSGSELRIVAVRDGRELIGLAPWFAHRGHRSRVDLRFLGAEISDRVDILCRPGREREVRGELLRAIREMRPRPDLLAFEAVPVGSQWARLLARGNPRLARYRNSVLAAPTVSLPTSIDQWLASRSNHFRKHLRWLGRRLAAADGAVRMLGEPGEIQSGIEAMLALHMSRWDGRGQSGLARPGLAEMLIEAAQTLGPDRLRLWTVEISGEPISVQLFLAAGQELKYWNGGWSEEHSALQPTMLTILAALEDAIARGERRLDLGAGTHPYKMRFADGEDPLTWGGLIVRNRRWPATRAELAPLVLRYRAKQLVRALPAGLGARIADLARRGGS
jgi:CelD/BcsL family acetyltransferase involved in cellulose biosynthesis